MTDDDAIVRAAGGVVWRKAGDDVEVIVVHRPKYDDWSLPKGKLDPGETWEEGAVREVREETGREVELGEFVGQVEYTDPRSARRTNAADGAKPDNGGRPKVVRYWAMRAIGGTFTPNREVDELRWLRPVDALALLTYQHDATMVERFSATISA